MNNFNAKVVKNIDVNFCFVDSKSNAKSSPKSTLYLDTLGQLPTPPPETLVKRAKSKFYTKAILSGMDFEKYLLKSMYMRAWFCSENITQNNTVLTSKYCDTRICNVCNRIRTAKMMNGYISQLQNRKLYFVTLTIPNVSKSDLKPSIELMIKNISNIQRVLRERRKIDINGIRKLEITYNAKLDNYHPHFHIIVDFAPYSFVQEWLNRYPECNIKAQHWTKASQSSLNELFKYTTKILAYKSKSLVVYCEALNNILESMYGKRTFQPFGNITKVSEEITDNLISSNYQNVPEYEFMEWFWHENDWINEHGEVLSGYIPPENLLIKHE